MESDPGLKVPEPVVDVHPRLTTLWVEALHRPETDLQRMAALTIARAHQRGIPGLEDSVGALETILTGDDSHPAARYAAARALVVLESRRSAGKLFAASQDHGSDLRQLVEPALADWGSDVAKARWVERVQSAETRPRELVLALRGLGALGESSVLPELVETTRDRTRGPGLRLEAASAAGQIAETGLEQDAEVLAQSPPGSQSVSRICAVRLLARHSSDVARRLLTDLAGHDEPAVAAAALQRLNEIDSALVLPMAASAIGSSDPQVRRQGLICLLDHPATDRIVSLAGMLTDPDPDLRRAVREGMLELAAEPELAEPIRDAAGEVLAGESWQGQEQASLLLGALDEDSAADRLVELLDSPREEVRLASAWALREIAVPETVPALIEHARRLTEFRRTADQPGLDQQVALLLEALGVLRAEDAAPLLLEYVPKRIRLNNLSRGAAIWALGRVYEGKGNEEVEAALAARILDFDPQPFEISLVKQMSAIALGRMQAEDRAAMMKQVATSEGLETPRDLSSMRLRLALGWAVAELTDEELPPPPPLQAAQESWFLEPLP